MCINFKKQALVIFNIIINIKKMQTSTCFTGDNQQLHNNMWPGDIECAFDNLCTRYES